MNVEDLYKTVAAWDPDILVAVGVSRASGEGWIEAERLLSFIHHGAVFSRCLVHADVKSPFKRFYVDPDAVHERLTTMGLESPGIYDAMAWDLREQDSQQQIADSVVASHTEVALCSLGEHLSEPERFLRIYRQFLGCDEVQRLTGLQGSEWMISPPRSLLDSDHGDDEDNAPRGGLVIYSNGDDHLTHEDVCNLDFASHYTRIIAKLRLSPDPRGLLGLYTATKISQREALSEETHAVEREALKRSYNAISGCLRIFFPHLYKAMTARGRELITLAHATVTASGMGSVIYGDTDGIMVALGAGGDKHALLTRLQQAVLAETEGGSVISMRESFTKFCHIRGKMYFGLCAKTGELVSSSMAHKNKGAPIFFASILDRFLLDFLQRGDVRETLGYLEASLAELSHYFCAPGRNVPAGMICKITRSAPNPAEEATPSLRALLCRMLFRGEAIPNLDSLVEYVHCSDFSDSPPSSIFETPDYFAVSGRSLELDWPKYWDRYLFRPLKAALGRRIPTLEPLLNSLSDRIVAQMKDAHLRWDAAIIPL